MLFYTARTRGTHHKLLGGIQNNPDIPKQLASQAQVKLAGGIPFLSDKDLKTALDKAGVPSEAATAIVSENANARINGLRASLSLLAVIALIAVFFSRRIPTPAAIRRTRNRAPGLTVRSRTICHNAEATTLIVECTGVVRLLGERRPAALRPRGEGAHGAGPVLARTLVTRRVRPDEAPVRRPRIPGT